METTPLIPAESRMGAVGLIVADLNRSLRYYHESIGLHVHLRSAGQAWLGAGERDLLLLSEQPGARPVQRGHTGLYHFALLVPSRRELARTLRHLIDTRTPLVGMSDHGVSEAIYLQDPDGHGIEIYCDRPREEWPRHEWPSADGGLQMTVDPLDVPALLSEVTSGKVVWHGLHAETTVGHVHLHVASLSLAERFYCEMIGFALTQRMLNQACFVSAGDYHHHLGLNVWAGVGAPPPPDDAARLAWYEIRMPSTESYTVLLDRLTASGQPMTVDSGRALIYDPSFNPLYLVDGEAL